MRNWIDLFEDAAVFYHGSRNVMKPGTRLVSQPDGYVQGTGMDDIEREAHDLCEAFLEEFRPAGAPNRAKAVYMVTDPEEIDNAGGYSDNVYLVEPESTPWKANMHWYSQLYLLCSDEDIDPADAKQLANDYWNAISFSPDKDLYEYLTTSAVILRVV